MILPCEGANSCFDVFGAGPKAAREIQVKPVHDSGEFTLESSELRHTRGLT